MASNKRAMIRNLALAAAAFTSIPITIATAAEPGKRVLKRRTRDQLRERTARPRLPEKRINQPGIRVMEKDPRLAKPKDKRLHQPGGRVMKQKPKVGTPADERARQPGVRLQPAQKPGIRMRKQPGIRMNPGIRMTPEEPQN